MNGQEEADMHFRKIIVLVALAAVTAAPSALALRPPIDAGDPGTQLLTHESGLPTIKVMPRIPRGVSTGLCRRQLQTRSRCLAFGLN
jgi:hypothetical protein